MSCDRRFSLFDRTPQTHNDSHRLAREMLKLMSRVHPINLNYALHKNPDLNLTSFLAVTIIWYYVREHVYKPSGMTSSTRCFEVKLRTALPNPPLFGIIATLALLFWPVATATVDL